MGGPYPERVLVYEVGPRDGLQNESTIVPTDAKVKYIEMLADAGFQAVESAAFVNPKAVPQMADASDVMQRIKRKPGVRYPVLVPNERGMQRAIEAGVREVAVFTAASESFARANINVTITQSLDNFRPVLALARQQGIPVRGYVSTALGCPYEGYVAENKVLEVTSALLDLGVYEVSLGDTIGVGTPGDVERVFGLVIQHVDVKKIAAHFHDTRGTALANVLAAIEMGVSTFDSSSAGLGGCPFAPGASGNLATEDLLYMLHGLGIETGVDLDTVMRASEFITGVLGRTPPSKYLQAYMSQHVNVENATI
jgi:isopropylmalate/homocitrate/citramalate synthase